MEAGGGPGAPGASPERRPQALRRGRGLPVPFMAEGEEGWWRDGEGDGPDAPGVDFRTLSFWDRVRTMLWVHKRRWLGPFKVFHKYVEQDRPATPAARSFAHSYARRLARLRRLEMLRPPLAALGLGGPFALRSPGSPAPEGSPGAGPEQAALGPDLAPAPGTSSSSYLIEIFRLQPFAAAAYLRALLYCWSSGVFLQVQTAANFTRHQPQFIERAAYQWLLCQLVLQLLQAPARLKLYVRLLEVSHSTDAEEASNRIRTLVTSRLWVSSQALGTVFHTVAAFGPVFLWLVESSSPVRRDVLSVCCANLLIFILRTALTFVIMHSILESRNSRPKPLKRGLTKESIARLRRVQSGNDDSLCMCSICLSHYLPGDALLVLPCDERHTFHDECITTWLVKNSSCPLCQRAVATG